MLAALLLTAALIEPRDRFFCRGADDFNVFTINYDDSSQNTVFERRGPCDDSPQPREVQLIMWCPQYECEAWDARFAVASNYYLPTLVYFGLFGPSGQILPRKRSVSR